MCTCCFSGCKHIYFKGRAPNTHNILAVKMMRMIITFFQKEIQWKLIGMFNIYGSNTDNTDFLTPWINMYRSLMIIH